MESRKCEIDPPSELKIWYPEIGIVSHGVTCCGVIHDSVCVLHLCLAGGIA